MTLLVGQTLRRESKLLGKSLLCTEKRLSSCRLLSFLLTHQGETLPQVYGDSVQLPQEFLLGRRWVTSGCRRNTGVPHSSQQRRGSRLSHLVKGGEISFRRLDPRDQFGGGKPVQVFSGNPSRCLDRALGC